jgi:hypothetical protein
MEINLSTLIHSIQFNLNLTEITAVKNLVVMVTMEHKQSKPTVNRVHLTILNLNNFKTIEAMGLKIIASRSP